MANWNKPFQCFELDGGLASCAPNPGISFCTIEGNGDNDMATKRTQRRHLIYTICQNIFVAPAVLNLAMMDPDN